MEKLSKKIASALDKYRESQEAIEATKQEIYSRLGTAKEKSDLFQEKFRAIKIQLHAYRDLLKVVMDNARIYVTIESSETAFSKGSARIVNNSHLNENNVLFSIHAIRDYFFGRVTCSFLAFCVDPETNHINVYEYTEPLIAESYKELHERRNAFKEHARHLTHDHIDKFNFDEIIPYIESYIMKELESMVERSKQPKRDFSDYWEYYYMRDINSFP